MCVYIYIYTHMCVCVCVCDLLTYLHCPLQNYNESPLNSFCKYVHITYIVFTVKHLFYS